MSDNRKMAATLLGEAGTTILKNRPGVHGSAEQSFDMIGDFWTIYIRHIRRVRGSDRIRPEDVAEMMSMLKKGRKVYGDPSNVDNDVDDIGYTALAGMLRLPDPDKTDDEHMDSTLASGLQVDEETEKPETITHVHTSINTGKKIDGKE